MCTQVKRQIPDAANLRVDRIRLVKLSDPDVSGSLMYSTVTFELEVSKQVRELQAPDPNAERKPRILLLHRDPNGQLIKTEADPNAPVYVLTDWQKCDGTYTVTLSTYRQLKNKIGRAHV